MIRLAGELAIQETINVLSGVCEEGTHEKHILGRHLYRLYVITINI